MWLAGSSRVAAWASRAIAHLALWAFALLAWLALTYLGFGVLTILDTAQGASVIHGGWLIAIVGTQSLVILGGRLRRCGGLLEGSRIDPRLRARPGAPDRQEERPGDLVQPRLHPRLQGRARLWPAGAVIRCIELNVFAARID